MNDRWGAYSQRDVIVEPLASGPLDGLSFAVKDVFAIKGHVSGAGNPDWALTHLAAERHAPVIEQWLNGGARLNGLTHTDEMMFSLNGENYHYGTPINPKAERHIPGGSSSGSAVAVAAGLVDFAVGTDTGGSVRIPASYCGIYGFRPTHSQVEMEGVIPLAKTFDTVGWMAESAKLLALVGTPLLGDMAKGHSFRRLIIAEDALAITDKETREALDPLLDRLTPAFAICETKTVSAEGLPEWMRIFRVLQGVDIWRTHGAWIDQTKPHFGPDIAGRFAWTRTLDAAASGSERQLMEDIRERLSTLLGDDSVLLIPTAPGPAPLRDTLAEELEEHRSRTLQLTCIAGLGGLPQVTMPWMQVEGCPVGLSLIAGPGQDWKLLQCVAQLEEQINSSEHTQNQMNT
ncbi:amidase [Paenibacillus sp. DS2015]|uniref:amidase n=1 Tax=Paenibacillus sp. DS2015 TaxID=3373917 RepID=UPI003D243B67